MLNGSDAEINAVAKQLISRRYFWLMVVVVPVVLLPGCVMGLYSTAAVVMYDHWWQKVFFLACALIGLSTPFFITPGLNWFHRGSARNLINELIGMEKAAVAQCLEALPQPAYFNAATGLRGGAIAVDPVSKKVALVFGQMLAGAPANTRTATLHPGELRSWRAEQPGVSTIEMLGSVHSSIDLMNVQKHNQQQMNEQSRGTGLRLSTESLDVTEVFLNFDYETAKRWVVLLDKFASGRLEAPSAHTEFPKQ